MFKVSKDTKKTSIDVIIVNFKHRSHLALVLLWLTLNKQLPTGLDPLAENHTFSTCQNI